MPPKANIAECTIRPILRADRAHPDDDFSVRWGDQNPGFTLTRQDLDKVLDEICDVLNYDEDDDDSLR